MQKTHLLATICIVTIVALACTSDRDSTSDRDLTNAQATAQAAIAERDAAVERAEAAEQRAQEAEEAASEIADTTSRLERIKQRGKLTCATGNDTPGFYFVEDSGKTVGFDVDLCRAVAAAVLGDADAVEYKFISLSERGPTLQAGDVDLMNMTTTWTSTRDINWGNFAPVMFYDGQGFMTRKAAGVESARDLQDAAVCVTAGTTSELNLADFSRQHDLNWTASVFGQDDTAIDAYRSEQCDVLTTDRSILTSWIELLPDPEMHIVLPDIISEEPLTPIVPHGDDQWFDIVKVVMASLIYAEAYGIDSSNVDAYAAGENIKAKRLLGSEGDFGQESLGLDKTSLQDVIKQVGNYGEIYERNLGSQGIGLPRQGRNDLWINGGQIYAAPLR